MLSIKSFSTKLTCYKFLFRANLVPVYGFGENDLLCQAQSPWLRKLQETFRSYSGIAPVMFYGRGIFQYSFGLMPFRVPVTLVGECLNLFSWLFLSKYNSSLSSETLITMLLHKSFQCSFSFRHPAVSLKMFFYSSSLQKVSNARLM